MKQLLHLLSFMVVLLLASSGVYAQEWKELVVNGDLEGSDLSGFSVKLGNDDVRALESDDVVVDDNDANNHCVKIVRPKTTYRNGQFIISLSEPLSKGSLIKFSMRAKGYKTETVKSDEVGNFGVTPNWENYTYESIVREELDGCQTITFTFRLLNSSGFYFDDVSVQVRAPKIIEFADPKVKEICVSKWDINGDGELNEAEAAAVEDLGDAFLNNQDITTFNELQYFIGLTIIDGAFYCCTNLTSITIPNNVTEIKTKWGWMGSFQWCRNLISVTFLGNKVETIDYDSFCGCWELTSINIPNSVISIGSQAFKDCVALPTLIIPSSVRYIEENSFQDCYGLTSIVVDEGNPWYDSRDNCNALIRTKSNKLMLGSSNSVIPNTVTTIADRAFSNNTGLLSLTIPPSVTTIGDGAFSGCGGLISIMVEEGNPTYDSRDNCNALIETAKDSLIRGSNNTIIPQSVKAIAPYAFSGCNGLTSITIPSGIKSIGEYAFNGCAGPNLLSIKVEEGNTVYDSRNNCNALIETATDSLILGCKNTIIPDEVTAIAPYAFSSCSDITSFIIPNSVRYIGDCAFVNCSNLSSVVLGNSVKVIGSFAFSGNHNLTNVYSYAEQVPDARGQYGNYAFMNTSMESATLHVPAASIEAYSYQYDNPWLYFGSIVALTDDDPKPSGITNVNQDIATGQQYYSLDGKRIATPQRGLNIVRMKNGTTRKVVVK